MDWQPIETAPKDGTLAIISDGSIVAPGSFQHGVWRFWQGDLLLCDEHGEVGNLNEYLPAYSPSHWMPLPEAPK